MFTHLKRLTFLFMLFCLGFATQALATDYTGWWWDSAQSGTGYSLEVQCNKAYLVWYLYGENGQNTWLSSILDVDGDTMSGELWSFDGWPLEAGFDGSEATPAENLGTVTLNFTDEDSGSITYDPAGEGENVVRTLERRLVGMADPRNLSGWWWDVNQQGIGWFLEAKGDLGNGDVMSVGWYNYRAPAKRDDGLPRFYVTWTPFAPTDTSYDAPLIDYANGQTLTGTYTAPVVIGTPGNILLNIPEDFDGTLDPHPDDGPSLDFSLDSHDYHLTRFTIPGSECPMGCTPEAVETYPHGSTPLGETVVGAIFQSPCGSHMDLSSATAAVDMRFGTAISISDLTVTNPNSDPTLVEITCTMEVGFSGMYSATFTVADEFGYQASTEWEFYAEYFNYRK